MRSDGHLHEHESAAPKQTGISRRELMQLAAAGGALVTGGLLIPAASAQQGGHEEMVSATKI